MKKAALVVVLCCSLGVGVASADIWKNIGRTIGKAWEDVKRETTKGLQPVEKELRKAFKNWEDEQKDKKKQECMQKCVGMRDNKVLEKVCADQCGWEL